MDQPVAQSGRPWSTENQAPDYTATQQQQPMQIQPDAPPVQMPPEPVPEKATATSQPQPAAATAPATVTPLEALNDQPRWIDCPFCQRMTCTRVEKEDSSATGLASLLCCLICICLVCLPQMAGWAQNTSHFCTSCRNKVAFMPHDGPMQALGPRPQTQVVSQYAQPQQQVAPPPPSYQQTNSG